MVHLPLLNALLLAAGVVLLVRSPRGAVRWPIVLVCAALIAAHAGNLVTAAAFITGCAALFGVRSMAAIAFCVVALPIDAQLDAFVGLPARMLIAQGVAALLDVPAVESVLQIESGLADVSLACSGVRSLWTGALVFFGVTAYRKARASLPLAVCYALALLVANFVRVFIIVLLAPSPLADLIHVPLGHLGFGLATAAVVWRVWHAPLLQGHEQQTPRPWLVASLTWAMWGALPPPAVNAGPQSAVLPYEQIALSPQERRLFMHSGARATKYRFAQGTLVVVTADTFKAHHAPEVCMATQGHSVALQAPGHYTLPSGHGVYWFQHGTRIEKTLLARALHQGTWTLVSFVFEGEPQLQLIDEVQHAVAAI